MLLAVVLSSIISSQANPLLTDTNVPALLCKTPILLIDDAYDNRIYAALIDAIQYWNSVVGRKILYSLDDLTFEEVQMIVSVTEDTNKEVPRCGVCNSHVDLTTGCIVRADIQISTKCLGQFTSIADNERLITIMRHELGHLLGLGHTDVETDLMHPNAWPLKNPASASLEAIQLIKSYYNP
jgi:predicted Zn-dependent protease